MALSKPKSRDIDEVQSRYWCITDHVHTDHVWWKEVFEANEVIISGIAQPEVAPSSGKLHVQVFIVLSDKRRGSVVRKWFPGAHCELMRAAEPKKAWDYCMKDETWTREWREVKGECPKEKEPGKRNDLERIRDLIKQGADDVAIIDEVPHAMRYLRDMTTYRNLLEEKKARAAPPVILRPWQEDLHRLLDGEIQPRRIIWVWSASSAVGKTTTMQYYMATRPNTTLVGTKNFADLLYAYKPCHRVIWFDFSRSNPLDATVTDVLEQVSNGGFLFAGKYQSTVKYVSANIVVTCNRSPPGDRLPMRCVEWRVSETGERVIAGDDMINGNWYNPDAGFGIENHGLNFNQ